MSVTIVNPPASEPVSLAEAKLYLRVDHDHEDDLIALLIAAAREAVETACGRALIKRRVRESLDIWRRDAVGGAVLSLSPVSLVHAVRLLAESGAQSMIDPERYRLEGAGDRPRLIFAAGLPATLRGAGGVEIEYEAGYAEAAEELPASLRASVLQIAAALYEAREGDAPTPRSVRTLARAFAPARL